MQIPLILAVPPTYINHHGDIARVLK